MLVDLWPPVEEGPQEGRETGFLLQLQQRLGVGDGGLHLEAVAHNAGICHQPGDILVRVADDARGVEAVERPAEILALLEDGEPRQARLEALQHELLEQRAVVGLGNAPFLVVIARVERVGDPGPRTALRLVRAHAFPPAAGEGAGSKVAQWGVRSDMATPPASSGWPLAPASAARSRRMSASPCVPATEPMLPISA